MVPRLPTPREHLVGVILVLLVAIIWVAVATVTQRILTDFRQPFFLTCVSSSGFSFLLLKELPLSTLSPCRPQLPRLALFAASLAPLFFVTCYTYNLGLAFTSVSSSSTITTLTTLFALIIGVFVGTDRFSFTKLVAVLITIVGVAIIASDDGTHHVSGDLLALVSSFTYAVYAIMLKNRAERPAFDIALVQGLMGLTIFISAWPALALFAVMGWEEFQLPSLRLGAVLLLTSVCGTVLSEFLFAKSVVLTSPVVSSLAITLTVPLSLSVDFFVKGAHFSLPYIVGTALVLASFVLVNLEINSVRSKEASTREGPFLEEEKVSIVHA